MTGNTHNLEIEKKFIIPQEDFLMMVKKVASMKPSSQVYVEGLDTYYINGTTNLRLRVDGTMCELTYKGRYKKESSFVREENDIFIDPIKTTPKKAIKFIRNIKFKKLFRIKKKNYIIEFDVPGGYVRVPFYSVHRKNGPVDYYAEIEPKKGMPLNYSKELVLEFAKKTGLDQYEESEKTLFEIYSGLETEIIEAS